MFTHKDYTDTAAALAGALGRVDASPSAANEIDDVIARLRDTADNIAYGPDNVLRVDLLVSRTRHGVAEQSVAYITPEVRSVLHGPRSDELTAFLEEVQGVVRDHNDSLRDLTPYELADQVRERRGDYLAALDTLTALASRAV